MRSILAVLAGVGCAVQVYAGFAAATDRTSYTGTVTRYATLADAQAGANAIGTYEITPRDTAAPHNTAYRDAGVFFVKNAPHYYTDSSIFLTAWWYTTNPDNGAYSGWGNPNNTNTGFTQLYDDNADTTTSAQGFWNSARNQFTLQASGANSGASEYARLWHAPGVGGAAGLTRGVFHSWSIDVTYGGLAAVFNNGGWESTAHPASVSGSFDALFENTNTLDPQYQGYYVVSYSFGMDNWAWANRDSLNGAFSDSYFYSTTVIPAPGAALLGLLGLAVTAWTRRRAD